MELSLFKKVKYTQQTTFKTFNDLGLFSLVLTCLINPDIDILAKHHFSGADIPKDVIKPIYIQDGEG